MTQEEMQNKINEMGKQIKEMQSYILGMTGNLNFKNTVSKLSKEAVIQQSVTVSRTSPDSELERSVSLSGNAETIKVLAYPDIVVYFRDKDNTIYKVPAYNVTL